MKFTILILFLFFSATAFAQNSDKPITEKLIVKTNLLNLLAQRPGISVEKPLSPTVSFELSYVQGKFTNILFTDHYAYKGFILRAKKYFGKSTYGNLRPYLGGYVGNLERNIFSIGRTDNSGWFGYPSRNFTANSLRTGGTFGLALITKGHVIFDAQTSLGYGRYLHLDKTNPNTYANGYLDAQVWFSMGYCF